MDYNSTVIILGPTPLVRYTRMQVEKTNLPDWELELKEGERTLLPYDFVSHRWSGASTCYPYLIKWEGL